MIEVGIPVYKAIDTLPQALDSLVAQTKNNFVVCLSIDGDGLDYSGIREEYLRRGLKIRIINSDVNGGPGMARQRILDTTICDYIMFLDADDMLMPRAVERLYGEAKLKNLDIMRSSFFRENTQQDSIIPSNANTITWFHGKVYKVRYLRDKNIRFLEGLRTDEDAYFNLIAWNATTNRGELDEITYIWRNNRSSLTRGSDPKEYFESTYMYYLTSQVEGLKRLLRMQPVAPTLITQTIINIHHYYMTARFLKLNEQVMDKLLMTLKDEQWMQDYLNEGSNWIELVERAKVGQVYNNEFVLFYEEKLNDWIVRLFKK